ncbi:hypothetical protein HK405_009461 [Cladochytrium tenue]|nr:hypothetical protein HK405_009461 [Cladochytrium tenue]
MTADANAADPSSAAIADPTIPRRARRRHFLHKTEMCRTFAAQGSCPYGARCQFAHSEEELRSVSRHPKWKTALCKRYWNTGSCPFDAECSFIHFLDEASVLLDLFGDCPSPYPPTRNDMDSTSTATATITASSLAYDPAPPSSTPTSRDTSFSPISSCPPQSKPANADANSNDPAIITATSSPNPPSTSRRSRRRRGRGHKNAATSPTLPDAVLAQVSLDLLTAPAAPVNSTAVASSPFGPPLFHQSPLGQYHHRRTHSYQQYVASPSTPALLDAISPQSSVMSPAPESPYGRSPAAGLRQSAAHAGTAYASLNDADSDDGDAAVDSHPFFDWPSQPAAAATVVPVPVPTVRSSCLPPPPPPSNLSDPLFPTLATAYPAFFSPKPHAPPAASYPFRVPGGAHPTAAGLATAAVMQPTDAIVFGVAEELRSTLRLATGGVYHHAQLSGASGGGGGFPSS